jgi:hypothetical protein
LKEGKKKSNSEINNLALDYINKKGDRRWKIIESLKIKMRFY